MDSYVVRIHRRHKQHPHRLAGVVEAIGKSGKKGFIDADSLWAILTAPWGEPKRKRKAPGGGNKNGVMTLGEIMNRIAKGNR